MEHVPKTKSYQWLPVGTLHNVQHLLFEVVKVGIQGEVGRVGTCAPGVRLGRDTARNNAPNGISMISAMLSMPMRVNATTVTTGTVAQPSSLTKTNGRENRYMVTHCLRWMLSVQ